MANKEFDDVQLDVEFTAASTRENLTSEENIAISFGKLAKWYNDFDHTVFNGVYMAHCDTAQNVLAKTVDIPNFKLRDRVIVMISFNSLFVEDDTTLNISNTGAFKIDMRNVDLVPHTAVTASYDFYQTYLPILTMYYKQSSSTWVVTNIVNHMTHLVVGSGSDSLYLPPSAAARAGIEGLVAVSKEHNKFVPIQYSNTDPPIQFHWPPKICYCTAHQEYESGYAPAPFTGWEAKIYQYAVADTPNTTGGNQGDLLWLNIEIDTSNGNAWTSTGLLYKTSSFDSDSYYLCVGIYKASNHYYFIPTGIVVYYDGTNITPFIPHPSITTSADTTSSASPGAGNAFTAIDSVTRDSNGHVTTLNTKTVTLPAGYTHPTYTANTEFGYKYVTWDTIGSVTGGDYQLKQYRGVSNSTGWVKIAQLKITGTYINQPLKLRVVQRATMGYDIVIRFANVNSKDPTLATFKVYMDTPGNSITAPSVYFNKTSTDATNGSTWDLYIKKLDGYDSIDIISFDFGHYVAARFELTWYADGTESSEQPTDGNLASVVTYAYGDVYGGLHTRTVTASNIDSQTGAFAFKGNNLIGGTADWAGIQLGYDNDMVQIVGGYNGLWVRQNDSGTWSNWIGLLKPNNVTAASGGGLTATITTTTAGTVDVNTGVSLGHSNSVTALTTSSLKKITYDANGHITASTDVQSADVSTLINLLATGSSAPNLNDYYVCQYVNGGTTTTSYHRRPISALWTTFKALITSTTTGTGNAITAASISNDGNNRKITFTKGDTFLTTTDAANDYVTKANGTITTKLTVGTGSASGQTSNALKIWTRASVYASLLAYWSYGNTWGDYGAEIAYCNQYDGATPGTKGALLLLPYQTTTNPYNGAVGMWVVKDHVYIDGVELSKVTHNHDGTYVPLTGSESMSSKFISVGDGSAFGVQNTAGTYRIALHIGTAGTNRGIWDWAGNYSGANNWILRVDGNNEVGLYQKTYNPSEVSSELPIQLLKDASGNGVHVITHNDSIKYRTLEGVAGTAGVGEIVVGNSTVKASAGNKQGSIRIYSTDKGYYQIRGAETTVNYNYALPAIPSYVVNGSNNRDIQLATNRYALVYDDTSHSSTPWYKFAEINITTTYEDHIITFLVSNGYCDSTQTVGEMTGILTAHIRTNGDKIHDSANTNAAVELKWNLACSNINPDDYVMVYTDTSGTGCKVELWCKMAKRYDSRFFRVLKEHKRREMGNYWTLYKTNGTGRSANYTTGTGTVTSTLCTIKNPTA